MKFYKDDFMFFNNDVEIKCLIPYVMIETASQTYGYVGNSVSISIEGMWNLVTMSQNKPAKREQTKIVELFKDYLHDETITDFKSVITVDGYNEERSSHYTRIELVDIVKIFTNSTLAKLPKHLALLLDIQSGLDGNYMYMTFEDLVYEITEETYPERAEWDFNNPEIFKRHTNNQTLKWSQRLVCFRDIEDILTKRHNEDKVGLNKPFMARDIFDDYIRELEEWDIICKVKTKHGAYGNKIVFCRTEHKAVVEQLYIHLEELGEYAEKKQQQEEPTQTVKTGGSFVQERRKRKASEAF
jgi:hypothetical protein